MNVGRRWTVRDRFGHEIYLTHERWEHILEGHPEMRHHENQLRETVRSGQRQQVPLAPQKYRYSKSFASLPDDNTHVVALVLFRFDEGEDGQPVENNYVVTAFQKEVG